MKLIWNIVEDGWTSTRNLCLVENEKIIWMSRDHLHEIDQTQFELDLKFIIEKFQLTEDCLSNIEENKTFGRIA